MSVLTVLRKRAQQTKTGQALAQTLKNELSSTEWPREGTVLEVQLIKKLSRQAFFDLGKFGTGVVYGLEFSNAREIIDKLEVGASIAAKVISLDGIDGYIELSLSEADKQRLWQQAKELQESGEVVKATITGANMGGVTVSIANLDLKAFLPASQLSNEHYPKIGEGDQQRIVEELKKFIGEEFTVKVIDVNPRNNKLIVSEREIVSENIKEQLATYAVGQVIDGIVSGIADFGAFVRFVDNPAIEGLIHISELDYRLLDSPKEVVAMDGAIKAKIIEIKDGRVFLSLKALKPDPWETVANLYKEGQDVSGRIYKFNPLGAIVALDDAGIQGVIHVSEFGGVEEMRKVLAQGGTYRFIIDAIKPEEKRLILKLNAQK